MPRPRNHDACNTCRRRKLKCSLHVPICHQCEKSGRYCDRSEVPTQFIHDQYHSHSNDENPYTHLKDPRIAKLFHSYISDISQWYDLADPTRQFQTQVPAIAMEQPLLFYAVITLSAMHAYRTSSEGHFPIAEAYHTSCVRLLISLGEDDELVSKGIALAATCLLRSYEILAGEFDPNMHLRGAYSMASARSMLSVTADQGLLESGFWNYLREDITYSLFEQRPLKINLETVQRASAYGSDQDHLNSITLILGCIINFAFVSPIMDIQLDESLDKLMEWFQEYPKMMLPFSQPQKDKITPSQLPAIWFLQPCHASAMHYYLVALSILAVSVPMERLSKLDFLGRDTPSADDLLDGLAIDICGIAFTAKTPSVIVNAFGPIAYCGRFIKHSAAREELERQLATCKKTIGWPVDRLIASLKVYWANPNQS